MLRDYEIIDDAKYVDGAPRAPIFPLGGRKQKKYMPTLEEKKNKTQELIGQEVRRRTYDGHDRKQRIRVLLVFVGHLGRCQDILKCIFISCIACLLKKS